VLGLVGVLEVLEVASVLDGVLWGFGSKTKNTISKIVSAAQSTGDERNGSKPGFESVAVAALLEKRLPMRDGSVMALSASATSAQNMEFPEASLTSGVSRGSISITIIILFSEIRPANLRGQTKTRDAQREVLGSPRTPPREEREVSSFILQSGLLK
jgi:hypothetical protein